MFKPFVLAVYTPRLSPLQVASVLTEIGLKIFRSSDRQMCGEPAVVRYACK